MNEIKIIVADYHKYKDTIIKIRCEVFVKEQKVPKELEMDEYDKDAMHVLYYVDNKPVGTGRIIIKNGHIGRIAVLKEYRGKYIGFEIMIFLMEKAKEARLKRVWLSAQLYAVDFYKKLGFVEFGDTFLDAGIKHINMQKEF